MDYPSCIAGAKRFRINKLLQVGRGGPEETHYIFTRLGEKEGEDRGGARDGIKQKAELILVSKKCSLFMC